LQWVEEAFIMDGDKSGTAIIGYVLSVLQINFGVGRSPFR